MTDIGDIVGQWKLTRLLGEGGFGRTYEAVHTETGKKDCVKFCLNPTPENVAYLRREAEILWDVHHYSLPCVRNFFPVKSGAYAMVMSYIEGKPLNRYIEKHQGIAPEDSTWIMERLLVALYYLQSNGIIHGDVKPPNVIVQGRKHNAWLVDFGLASVKPVSGSTALGYTNVFAAPEIIDCKPPIPESDLYSLGLTSIYMLGGDPVAKNFPSHVPKPLQEFILGLCRYNPLERTGWDTKPIERFSDVRFECFGRRHSI